MAVMPNLDVDSDTLRAAGKDLSDTRETAMGDNNVHMMDVFTQGQLAISTGGYPPGALAMQRLVELYQNVITAHQTVVENLIGLSSGLHIVADVYDKGEYDQALAYAFQLPDAQRPDGLPKYVNPSKTYEDWLEPDDGDAGTGEPGGEDSRRTETEYITSPDPTHPTSTTQITRVYDGDNLVASHYVVRHPDGSTTYYTEVPRDGGTQRINEVTVGAQNPHATSGESVSRYNGYYEDQREQIQQQLDEYGLFQEEGDGGGGGGGGTASAE